MLFVTWGHHGELKDFLVTFSKVTRAISQSRKLFKWHDIIAN